MYEQCAGLINLHNRLTRKITANDVSRGCYFCVFCGELVIGCVEIRKVSWWSYEVRHMTVHQDYRHIGIGTMLLKMAERAIQNRNRHIMLATTRADNKAVIYLNKKFGMSEVCRFINPESKREILVWIKNI